MTKLIMFVSLREMAGAVRLELTTVGFGDRCSTIRTMPLWNCPSIINNLQSFVNTKSEKNSSFLYISA